MDDQKPANESNEPGLNKIDLTQLNSFTFGTQWTEAKVSAPSQRRDRDFDRGDRRDDGNRGGPPGGQRDRRSFHKPVGAPGGPAGGVGAGGPSGPSGAPQGDRRSFGPGGGFNRGDRPPQGQGGEGYRGGPRREFQGGERRDFRGNEGGQFERGPYISPYFNITCYPEDAGFAALVKAVRTSCRTFQLFEITKAVLEKNDRFVLVIQRKTEEGARPPEGTAPAEPAKPQKSAPLFLSLPDHLPFESEDAAIQHVLKNNLSHFFETAEVEVDPPKGNFPIINKCSITGELLGPPNHHRYQHVLQQHHATKLASRMSFDQFRDGVVSVREPEIIQQWMDKMKKVTRYTWKPIAPKPATVAAGTSDSANPVVATESSAPVEAATASAEASAPAPVAEVPVGPSFDSYDEARAYLLTNAKDKVVRALETVRFHGKLLEKLPGGEMKRAIEGHVERQRRFPLDTANALRGRLRREGFTIFKKGSRGVSYVCAVKRHFRVPGQVFSVSITGLIEFIEKNPMIHVKDLPLKFLNIDLAAAIAAAPAPEGATASPMPHLALPPEQADVLRKMNNDLRWLVTEGYVTEFSDGKLFAPPPVAPQAAKRGEEHGEEHDPVDFPDAPAPVAAANVPAASPAVEAAIPTPQAEPAAPVASTEPVPAPAEPVATEFPKPEIQA